MLRSGACVLAARAGLMPDLYVHIYMFVLFVCSAVGRQMEGHLKEVSLSQTTEFTGTRRLRGYIMNEGFCVAVQFVFKLRHECLLMLFILPLAKKKTRIVTAFKCFFWGGWIF